MLGPSDDPERGLLSTLSARGGKYAEKLWLESAGSRKKPHIAVEDLEGEDPAAFRA